MAASISGSGLPNNHTNGVMHAIDVLPSPFQSLGRNLNSLPPCPNQVAGRAIMLACRCTSVCPANGRTTRPVQSDCTTTALLGASANSYSPLEESGLSSLSQYAPHTSDGGTKPSGGTSRSSNWLDRRNLKRVTSSSSFCASNVAFPMFGMMHRTPE